MNTQNSSRKHGSGFVFLFVFFVFFSAISQIQAYTLDEILSYLHPTDLISSPKGDLAAWVFNEKGRRNIWVAQGHEDKARQLTHYGEDDGQELTDLAFSSDGSIIVFVRGGEKNQAGENPNPTSNPEGAEQAIWAVKVSGGEPWRLAEGSGPVVASVGNFVAYDIAGKIFLSSLEGGMKPRPLFKARGRCSAFSWSPDASKLVFVSSREDHSFIGIYDLKKKSILWVSPFMDRDVYPAWSLDGKQIAFLRAPGLGASPARFDESISFSLMLADAESGKAYELWKCPNESGGFAQSYPGKSLMWAARGRLLFYSEHEGWIHLYSFSIENKQLQCLTPGNFEVENCCLSPDRETLFFNSNSNDLDRRHLWSVPVSGGMPKLLTPGSGLEWSPTVSASGKNLIFLCSTATQPAAPAIADIQGAGRRLIAPDKIPTEFPIQELVQPEQVVFKAPDGLDIHGQLFLPKSAKAGDNRPAAIFMHGGPIRQMLLGWHYLDYYHHAYALNQYLASKGYVVLSVNYRSGIGYGRAFRTAPNRGPLGASEYQDIIAAAKYLQNRLEVNPQKIGLWGGSYGGYLTAMGLARNSELFAAGVDLHGVHDWSVFSRRFPGAVAGREGEELMRSAYQSSPVSSAYFWTSPVLFIHGDDDRNVDFNQTNDMVQRLRKLGKAHVEVLVFPDEVHDILRFANLLNAYQAASDFFDRYLKK
jgi:dipeptidyl aminopeptidase/acylaminoacyl peptidase